MFHLYSSVKQTIHKKKSQVMYQSVIFTAVELDDTASCSTKQVIESSFKIIKSDFHIKCIDQSFEKGHRKNKLLNRSIIVYIPNALVGLLLHSCKPKVPYQYFYVSVGFDFGSSGERHGELLWSLNGL